MNSEISIFVNILLILTSYILISHISHGDNPLQCYDGTVTSAQTVEVKNCTIRLVKSHVTSTNTSQSLNTSSHSSIGPSNISSNYCLIFRHLSLIFNHKSYVKFSCDFENICHERNTGKFMKYTNNNNLTGELLCCNTFRCNLPKLTSLPKQALKCYHAKKQGEGTIVGCSSSGGHCASTREFHGGVVRHQFFCDNKNICNKNASIITEGCKNISLDNNTSYQVEICCCTENFCNKPQWVIATSTAPPVATHATTPLMQSSKQRVDWTFIGGLLALLAIMGGLIIGAVIFVRKSKKKEEDPHGLGFRYRRIAADQLEVEEEDDTVIGDNVQLVLT